METRIEIEDGKYAVVHDNGADLRALRYGEPWRDLTGDGLVLAMAQEIEALRPAAEVGQQLVERGITLPQFDDISDYLILAVKKGTLNPLTAEFLQHCVQAVSLGENLAIVSGEAGQRLVRISDLVADRFRDAAVDTITLTRAEVGL